MFQRLHQRKRREGFLLALIIIVIVVVVIISQIGNNNNNNNNNNTNTKNDESGHWNTLSTLDTVDTAPTNTTAISDGFDSAAAFEPALSSQEFLDQLFDNAENPMSKLYLPNYAYSQSLVYSEGDVNIFGQVRILGGVVSKGRTQLGYGAMVTAVPEYVTRRTGPTQNRFHISEWKEL